MFSKTESITMTLSGVNDAAAQHAAVKALRQVDGVKYAAVNRRLSVAEVTFSPKKTTVDTITQALAQAGFSVL
ncbi:MAG: heavy-metal-associated domain-containing protein [Clostridia bacterium]|jgi:copper chaperone CopZ|nr:heavy-metal-associated domain-containing protein [Clostridia bacterium]